MRLWSFIRKKLLKNSDALVWDSFYTFTYSELLENAEAFSDKIKGEKCCVILCDSPLNEVIALFACLAADITAVPLTKNYGIDACRKIMNKINPTAIINDHSGKLELYCASSKQYLEPSHKIALIMCTSGTSGEPKGVMLSDENILSNVKSICRYFKIGKRDTLMISRPIYHCAVITGELLTAIARGAKIYFYRDKLNPSAMLKAVKTFGVTAMCSTPTVFEMLSRFNRNGTSLKKLCVSGEPLGKATARLIRDAFPTAEIHHVYGLTEASPRVSHLPPRMFEKYPDFVGFTLRGVHIKILSSDGNPCKRGQDGILWVRGKNVSAGYFNDSSLTEKAFQNGFLCTGDIVARNRFGLLKIKGRADGMIIRAGVNIYPAEIENALKADSRICEAVAYGIQTESGMQIGISAAGDFSTASELKMLCNKLLPPHMQPSQINLLKSLEKGVSGKIKRQKHFTEHEIKLLLSEGEYDFLFKNVFGVGTAVMQKNHYYDDENYSKTSSGTTYRIREKGGHFTATVKSHLGNTESREESFEVEGVTPTFPGEDTLKIQGFLETERIKKTCESGITLCLDKNNYLDECDFELEIEYPVSAKAELEQTIKRLACLFVQNGFCSDEAAFISRIGQGKRKAERFFEEKSKKYFKPDKGCQV